MTPADLGSAVLQHINGWLEHLDQLQATEQKRIVELRAEGYQIVDYRQEAKYDWQCLDIETAEVLRSARSIDDLARICQKYKYWLIDNITLEAQELTPDPVLDDRLPPHLAEAIQLWVFKSRDEARTVASGGPVLGQIDRGEELPGQRHQGGGCGRVET